MGGKSSQSQQVQSIPPDVLARYNAVNAKAEQVAATPFQQYSSDPSGFVAPLNPVQTGAIQQTQEYANLAQPYYNLGTGLTLAGAGAANPEQLDIGQYMSPYLGSVVGSTLANLQQQQQQDQSALNGTAIGAGAFGGDRSGIAQANLARQQELATGQTVSGILNQGYGQALSTAQQQQGVNLGAQQANLARLAQAGQGIAGLGAGAQQAGLSGAQAQLAAGTASQQTQQAGLSALYNQFLQQQGYPFQTTQFLANIAEGTGALSGGTTGSTQPSSFFSDERLKENIETIGHTHDGMKIIKFNYKGHPEKQIGFSAQDVEKHHPEAVGESQGYKTVDYDKATQQSAHLGHHKDSMGGSVHEGHAGEGYAKGGLTTDDIIKQIMLASQKTMPYGGVGLYGDPNFNRSGAYDTSQADLQMGFRKGPPGPAGLRPSDYVAPVAFASGGVVPHMADGGIPDYLTIMQQAYGNSPWAKAIGAVGGGLGIPTQAPAARSLPKPSALPAQQKSGLQETAGLGMQGLEGYKAYTDIQKNLADADKKEKGLASVGYTPSQDEVNAAKEYDAFMTEQGADADQGRVTLPTDSELGFGLGTGEYRGGLVRHHYGAGGLPYNTDDPYVPAEDTEQKPPQKLQNPQEIAKKPAGNPVMGGLGGAALTAALTSNPWLIGAAGLMGALSQSKRGGLITGHPHYAEGGLAPRHGYAEDGAVEDEPVDPIQAANDEISPDQLAEAQNVFTDVAPPAAKPAAFDVGRKAGLGEVASMLTEPLNKINSNIENSFENWKKHQQEMGRGSRHVISTPVDETSKVSENVPTSTEFPVSTETMPKDIGYQETWKNILNLYPEFLRPPKTQADMPSAGLAPPVPHGATGSWSDTPSQDEVNAAGGPSITPEYYGPSGVAPRPAAPPPKDSGVGGNQPTDTRDWFSRNRNWLMPLLGFVGTTASSPSRYLGTALAQGALGAGQAAAKNAEQQMQLATQESDIAKGAYDSNTNTVRIFDDNGNMTYLPYQQFNRDMMSGVKHNLAPYGSASTKTPVAETAQPLANQKINYGPNELRAASADMDEYSLARPRIREHYEDTSNNMYSGLRNEAETARQSRAPTFQLMQALSMASPDASGVTNTLNVPGFGATPRAQAVNFLNTVSRAFGGKGNEFGEGDQDEAISNKINTLSSQMRARAGGERAYQALEAFRSASPNRGIPPEAAAELASQLMVQQQRNIDKMNFATPYGRDSGGYYGSNFERAFDSAYSEPQYRKEADVLKRLMLSPNGKNIFKKFNAGELSIDDMERGLVKSGAPETISRYFGAK